MNRFALLLPLPLFALGGCCSPTPIFQAPVVSMTRANMSSLKEGDSVSAKWCTGDDPVTGKSSTLGMMDEVIMKAQKKAHADAITNARFIQECSCLTVKGTAAFAGDGGGNPGHKKKKHAEEDRPLEAELFDPDDVQ